MKLPRDVLLAALVVTGACSASASGPTDSAGTLGGVGVLPGQAATPIAPVAATKPIEVPSRGEVIGGASGNRLIVIGDSILASTSARYSNDMCEALVPLGWQVEVDAETSRFIDFADQVLDRRLSAGFDAVVIGLGSNYGKKEDVFHRLLEEAVVRVSPRPVVLVTVTEFDPSRREVNHAIAEIAAAHDNVVVADWATASETAGYLGPDGLHLTPRGRTAISAVVATAVGTAPAQPGSCLDTKFVDDSRGSVEGGPATTANRTPGTTARPSATTKPTTAPTSPSTPTGTVTTTTPAPTTSAAPATTARPVATLATMPPTTQPPASAAPPTQPTAPVSPP